MKSLSKVVFPAIISAVFIGGCVKPTTLPDTPIIEYVDFIQLQDSALFVFSFTDGDGDIGLKQGDTLSPLYNPPYYHPTDTSKNKPAGEYYYNFHLDYWEKRNGEFVMLSLNPPFYYRIPEISNVGQKKSLEGEISITIRAPYYSPLADTIKYSAYIYDRAKHKSNVIESPEIVISH